VTIPDPRCLDNDTSSGEALDTEGASVIATDDGLVLYEWDELPPS
jgi:hypothetical protein